MAYSSVSGTTNEPVRIRHALKTLCVAISLVVEPEYVRSMYPGTWAARTPDKPALVMAGSGRTLTYAEWGRWWLYWWSHPARAALRAFSEV